MPYVFAEQGIAMLSGVLNSDRAIHVNIAIMRAFVTLREIIASNKELAEKLSELEKKYDAQFRVVFDAIRALMTPPESENNNRLRREESLINPKPYCKQYFLEEKNIY